MSVYNTKEEYLREAIDSILNQSFSSFEFIIVDDASNDETKKILSSYSDERIRMIKNDVNHGLTYNLNRTLEVSSGKYIARMDADDVAHPDRIERQVRYMEENEEVNILGSYMNCGGTIRTYWDDKPWEYRKVALLFENIGLGHPSVMFRKSFLDEHKLKYDETMKKSQDFELWTRCIEYTNLYVYPECLMDYRIHDGQISTALSSEQQACIKEIKRRQLNKFRTYLSQSDIDLFSQPDETSSAKLSDYRRIMRAIIKANDIEKKYNSDILKYVLRRKYRIYLNYHYLNLYRIEKYIVWPLMGYGIVNV